MSMSMICPLGQSPAVVTEAVRYLAETEALKNVIIFATEDENVKAGVKMVKACMKVHYPKIRVFVRDVPFADITCDKDNWMIMKKVSDTIRNERNNYRVDEIVLNIAGGRKATSVSLGTVAGLLGVTVVLHIIHKDVKRYNLEQERLMHKIVKFLDVNDEKSYYLEHAADFDSLMFPPPEDLNIIRIPIVPFPPDERALLRRLLKGIRFDEEFVEDYKLETYRRAGFITYDRLRTYPTEDGEKLLQILGDAN